MAATGREAGTVEASAVEVADEEEAKDATTAGEAKQAAVDDESERKLDATAASSDCASCDVVRCCSWHSSCEPLKPVHH